MSVRINTCGDQGPFRFRQIGGEEAVLTPVVSASWHVKGTVPPVGTGAGQDAGLVLIEKSSDLSEWLPETVLYARIGGEFVRSLAGEFPLGNRGFYRGIAPEIPLQHAVVAMYNPEPPYYSASGYGYFAGDMPQLYRDGNFAAVRAADFHRDGQLSAGAGECYELAGPHGRTTVMIVDIATPPAGIPEEMKYFDLGPVPFGQLTGGSTEDVHAVTTRLVPAPVTGGVKYRVAEGSHQWWAQFRIYNHRVGVSMVELKHAGSETWWELVPQSWNTYVYATDIVRPAIVLPLQLRVTSRFGEVVTFGPSESLENGHGEEANAQFEIFPESASAPEPVYRVRPMYVDRFTKVPGDNWSATATAGVSLVDRDTAVFYQGDASMRITGLGGFKAVTCTRTPRFPAPENGVMRLAVRAESPVPAGAVEISFLATGMITGGIGLPALNTEWQVFELPLEANGVPMEIQGWRLMGNTAGALPQLWIDAVEFVPN